MKFYRAPNKRLIARGTNGKFRQTTLEDIGMAECETCGVLFVPDVQGLSTMADPRDYNRLRRFCSEHGGSGTSTGLRAKE
jgi:hypothetical protein